VKALCRALLVLDLLYCALALSEDRLPAWRMFDDVDDVRHTLVDRDGAAVDIRAWLPRGANLVDRGELRRVVRFVCRRERARAPFVYDEHATRTRAVLGEECELHGAR